MIPSNISNTHSRCEVFIHQKKRFVFCPFYLIWCCYFFFVLAKSSKMWRDIGFVPLKDFLWFRFFSHHHYHHHHLRRKYWKEKNPIMYMSPIHNQLSHRWLDPRWLNYFIDDNNKICLIITNRRQFQKIIYWFQDNNNKKS